MKETLIRLIEESGDSLIKAVLILLILILTFYATRIFRRYIAATAKRHNFAPQRSVSISKLGQGIIYTIGILSISNVLGFGIQEIFIATSAFFAVVGIAFFANWSILSNVTASVFLYFTFPYRIGDRIIVENEPNFSGILKDVTLMYLKIQTDKGSYITLPANVAIQKIITAQSEADYQAMLKEIEEDKGEEK